MNHVMTQELEEQAIAMRESGSSYRKISSTLGISEWWCRKNLTDIENKVKIKYEKLYKKSKTKDGVSKQEIAYELDIYDLPEEEIGSSLNSAVRRIRSNNKQNIVRPDWMMPDMATFITDRVVALSMEMEDRLHEEAYRLHLQIKENTDESRHDTVPSVNKLKAAIAGLTLASVRTSNYGGVKLNALLESLYNTATALEQRNNKVEVLVSKRDAVPEEDYQDLEDLLY